MVPGHYAMLKGPPPHEPMPSESTPEAPVLDVRALLVRTVAVLVTLGIGAAAVGWAFREPLQSLSKGFVTQYGGWGVALGFFVPDATSLPIPSDLFVLFALAGGMPVTHIIAFATLGSIAGGCTAFAATRLLRDLPALTRILEADGPELKPLVDRYGAWALAVGALTPLPYSLTAYACGLLGMPFRTFLAVSCLRVVRVGLYLGLVRLGLIGAGM